jgi:hypothetical protein
LSGITYDQVSSKAFTFAIDFVIGSAIGAPAAAKVQVVARPLSPMAAPIISVVYAVNVTSGMDPTEMCNKVQDSLDTGAFLEKLRLDTGYPITNMTNALVSVVGNAQGDGLNPTPSGLPTTALFLPGTQTGKINEINISMKIHLSVNQILTHI